MDSNYHSTVLQRPPLYDDRDQQQDGGDRRRGRDILNPASPSSHSHRSDQTHRPGSRSSHAPAAFGSLRSPSQTEFHHSQSHPNAAAYSASPPTRASGIPNSADRDRHHDSQGPRPPILQSSYMQSPSAGASSHPPPLQPPTAASASSINSQPPPRSPLHAPSIYYPHGTRDSSQNSSRPAARSFYDPLTDTTTTTSDGQASGAAASPWQNSTQATTPKRDPYAYSQNSTEASPYYNGRYPANVPSNHFPTGSPPTQSYDTAARSPPTSRSAARYSSPGVVHAQGAVTSDKVGGAQSATMPLLGEDSPPRSAGALGSNSTPSRAAGVMSFSNILSSVEPAPKPRPPPIAASKTTEPEEDIQDSLEVVVKHEEPEQPDKSERVPKSERRNHADKSAKGEKREKQASRSAKPRTSDAKPSSRRLSAKEPHSASKMPVKRQANGQPKPKQALPADKERRIHDIMAQLDDRAASADDSDFDDEERTWRERALRRRREMESREADGREPRRSNFTGPESKKLMLHADLGRRRYDDVYYDEAAQKVREKEIFAEKERKKDMQRKRRREKSMAVTMEQREAALLKARQTEDPHERQRLLKEADRASKKAHQTKLILQKGLKGPSRNLQPSEVNMEGGTMATFQAADMEPGARKGKGRGGPRPKKSKEQKQAEKESAEAAQAAIDAGEELPSKEETKIRIKFSKKAKVDDPDKDKENQEPSEVISKGKGKAHDEARDPLETKFQSKGYNQIYDQIWRDLARKDVSKIYKMGSDSYATKASNLKKTAILASKEAKRWQLRTNKGTKDLQARAKRVMRDMMGFWKRNEREERDLRKAAEKQELENARKEEADREAARQKRKLNFLISQTELYSHFIGKKIKTNEVERSTDRPEIAEKDKAPDPNAMQVDEPSGPVGAKVTDFENIDFDAEDDETLQQAAMANAQNAIAEAQQAARNFNRDADGDGDDMDEDGEMNFQNPTGMGDVEIEQPKMLNAQLKEYQLKGLNWLVNLYEQGINGILADEMGLGKTVQSISVMAYLAEKYDIWGPFLVVAPASTLHNWQQEIARFVPNLKVLPYWGTAGDRKVLRKFWDRKHSTYKQDASFHVLVTSYQLVVADVAYFQKMRWQYMILDEAQAIKSSQSSRWKCLLGFHCRNRLLLTGTPIQNNMQELWALLHFIMPTLFDSHDEFSEWFSKDIESHAQSNTKLNEDQLKRLHMILKPFMLRRVKKHVQKELGDKIELDVFCDLTYRQRAYYGNLRNQISIMDLIEKATLGDDNDSGTLMNLVMQFRKVCNHPDLFERADTTSPFACTYYAQTGSFIREGNNVAVGYSTRNLIEYSLPRKLWREDGRLFKAGRGNEIAGWRNKALSEQFNIWTPENVKSSLSGTDNFSWLRFADTSPEEVYKASHHDLFTRAAEQAQKSKRLGNMTVAYAENDDRNYVPGHALFNIRERNARQPLADITESGVLKELMNVGRSVYDDLGLTRLEQAGRPEASAPPIDISCSSTGTAKERDDVLFNLGMRKALFGPNLQDEKALVTQGVPLERFPPPALLPTPDSERKRFTNVVVPSMRRFVTDSGKLAQLDELLFKLKEGGHRVLLYFQMTRMIDLMEEYLTYRNYRYCRLDGSTKLEDRRDTVHDFQTRPEIFIFLLSTRAGGLGINLTSADTVIFYDSDWNPTIDSQAMDRAHRLGQTKQVTVYRLITRGTIEERIRKRALQKEEVQRVVIQGGGSTGGGGVDFSGRRAPENKNRDIAMWLVDDEEAALIEQREKELLESGEYDNLKRKKGGKRKKAADNAPASLDDMYHEGEGHFDDKNSGTATPTVADEGRKGKPKAKTTKKKTAKQRLAIADGAGD